MSERIEQLEAGMVIPFGGDRFARVDADLAAAFEPGDRLVVVQDSGALLRIPASVWAISTAAVGRAHEAFGALGGVADANIDDFYDRFAASLADDGSFAPIIEANERDCATARERGRSTTRLELSESMRDDMIAGLRSWRDSPSVRDDVVETIRHDGWTVEQRRAGLGVVGFVFEGRPNVFADATGVLRSGNAVVFRIGSDALGTAQAIVTHALDPALASAGLPPGTATLLASAERSAGWAMFSDPRLALAVARGSGGAVAQLGAVARQAGIPVSLHGTGGAWLFATEASDGADFVAAVEASLDRKVCNTLNTCCIVRSRADELVPLFLDALGRAGERRAAEPKLHVTSDVRPLIPSSWWDTVSIDRADGPRSEPRTEEVADRDLGVEWEWENSPEVTLTLIDDLDDGIARFNALSPRFTASVISGDDAEHRRAWQLLDAPFVGNGFTRWVDGQYALDRPELGLSNWQHGRLFGRGAVLSGDSVYTVRTKATQADPELRR